MKMQAIAKVCHEALRAYAEACGDDGVPPWEQAPTEERASMLDDVVKIASTQGITPEQMHEDWMRRKIEQGWTLGQFDRQKKQHPAIVPWRKVPRDYRVQRHLVHALTLTLP